MQLLMIVFVKKEKKEDNVISNGFKNYKIIFDDIFNRYIIKEL